MQAEDRVTSGDVLRDDANREQIVNLIERNLGTLHLLIDGIETLDAPLDFCLDVVFAELIDERIFDAFEELLALAYGGLRRRLETCSKLTGSV